MSLKTNHIIVRDAAENQEGLQNPILNLSPNKECEPIATGFQHLDHLTGRLRTGQLCTIAAPFRMDKTAFAVSLLRNIGVIQKVPTAYFSLELSELEIMRARNPRMQNMLRMIGYGENLGSGFPLILTAWKDARWGEPVLKNKVEIDEVELELPIKTKNATANVPANGTVNGTVNATVKLNKTQMKILPILQANKYATYEEIANQTGMARSTVGRNLDDMKKKSVIQRVGGDKNGHWEILLDFKDIELCKSTTI